MVLQKERRNKNNTHETKLAREKVRMRDLAAGPVSANQAVMLLRKRLSTYACKAEP